MELYLIASRQCIYSCTLQCTASDGLTKSFCTTLLVVTDM